MTRGNINLKVVLGRLGIVLEALQELRALPADSLEVFLGDFRNPAAAESLLRRAIESLLDIARHLLAKTFGHGALEPTKVAQLAIERGLVRDPEAGRKLLLLAGYRNRLTHIDSDVTHEELYGTVRDGLGDIEQIAAELRAAAARLSAR